MPEAESLLTGDLAERAWTLTEAYDHCREVARHYENFPVGSRLIPRRLRPHVHAVYAFARTADDYADEPGIPDGLRTALLENWESQLLQCVWRKPQHPVFIALKDTIQKFNLPISLFQDLIYAFRIDVNSPPYERFEDLLGYCRLSADPIGRLVLLLFGYRDREQHGLSDRICSALQLANFWQDLSVDLRRGRSYLPLSDLAATGLSIDDLLNGRSNEAYREMMARLVGRTRDLFREGEPLCRRVGRNLRWELNFIWLGGNAILDRIEAADYDVFTRRPVLSSMTKFGLALRAASRAFAG